MSKRKKVPYTQISEPIKKESKMIKETKPAEIVESAASAVEPIVSPAPQPEPVVAPAVETPAPSKKVIPTIF
jgi:hypothetical protein